LFPKGATSQLCFDFITLLTRKKQIGENPILLINFH
jgi:hypothetical protein